MITEKQKQILKLLMTTKDGYNVNQISKILGISVSWCHETLKNLEREEVLSSVKIANTILFKINWKNPKAEKMCDFVIIDQESKNLNKFKTSNYKIEISSSVKETKVIEQPREMEKYQKITNVQNQGDFYKTEIQNRNIDNPYRQSINLQNSFSYGVAPVGSQGVNNVLNAYANFGAFGALSSPYSSNPSFSSTSVPPDSLGSKISGNVSGFTLAMHTASHKEVSDTGCRYCGPEIKSPF